MLNAPTGVGGENARTCLGDAIIAILPSREDKELMRLAIATSIPADGDTSILRINNALATQGLILNQVNGRYIKKHGAPYNLLQERECRLIIGIKLTSLDATGDQCIISLDGTERLSMTNLSPTR